MVDKDSHKMFNQVFKYFLLLLSPPFGSLVNHTIHPSVGKSYNRYFPVFPLLFYYRSWSNVKSARICNFLHEFEIFGHWTTRRRRRRRKKPVLTNISPLREIFKNFTKKWPTFVICLLGVWNNWSPWSACSGTCGNRTKISTRTCKNNGLPPCEGSAKMVEVCESECLLQSCDGNLIICFWNGFA